MKIEFLRDSWHNYRDSKSYLIMNYELTVTAEEAFESGFRAAIANNSREWNKVYKIIESMKTGLEFSDETSKVLIDCAKELTAALPEE